MGLKLITMVQFIIEMDWLSTKEFCTKYNVPRPRWTGDIKSSSDQLLNIDAIKHKMFVEYAKILNKEITVGILQERMGFKSIETRSDRFTYKNGKVEIVNDQYGFWFNGYDGIDGKRISRVEDLVSLELEWTGKIYMINQ